MLKTLLMRAGVVTLLLCAVLTQSWSQAAFWSETFSDQASATTNWVNGGTNAGATPQTWTWTNDLGAGYQTPTNQIPPYASASGATGYFYFNSDANGAGVHDVTLTGVGNPANTTGKSDVRVRFHSQYAYFNATGVTAQLGVSTNGTTFTYFDLFDGLPANNITEGVSDIDLGGIADNAAQVWLQFRWVGDFEYHWKLDDVELYEYQVPQRSVTFKVNMALTPAVDPAGVRIAGSFTGWQDVVMTNEGNGVWSHTATLPDGEEQLYKFKNGPNGWESGQQACGVSDGFGGYNRNITPTADVVLPAICFNSCAPCVLSCTQDPNSIICDNFDTYNTNQRVGPQADHWDTWSGTEGGAEDGIVSTDIASTAPNSMKLVGAAGGGPQDVMLLLGNKTSGRYSLKWKMHIATGKAGYYNIQNVYPIANQYNLDVFFNADGTGDFAIGSAALSGEFTYPQNAWFDVEHEIDLDNNILRLKINGNTVKVMAYPNNLGGIDFYCINATYAYYVDNIDYRQLAPVVFQPDNCETAADITPLLGSAPGVVNTSSVQDLTGSVVSPSDPTTGFECHFQGDALNFSEWFTFTGDGNTYRITSIDCGASPIPFSDAQFALYTGSCGAWTPLECNDDIDFPTILNAELVIETEPGEQYYLLVDAYATDPGNYCLEVEQIASVLCADAEVGTHELTTEYLCFGEAVSTIQEIDLDSWTLSNQGPVSGFTWGLSAAPLDPTVWPGGSAGILEVSFFVNPDVFPIGLINNGVNVAAGSYYLTPVIVAGATFINPAAQPSLFNIEDPTAAGGCFFIGESLPITFLPELNDLVGAADVTNNANGTVNINLTVEGGLGEALGDPSVYQYNWSNGATTQNLTNVPNVGYSVTITDPSGCVAPFVLSGVSVDPDPKSVKSLVVTPNPTSGLINLNLEMEQAADVQIEVVNQLGQLIVTQQLGKAQVINHNLDLTAQPAGLYTLRVRMDDAVSVRRIAVQH
jgi:Secretion system C-terminal sorting domain